MAAALPFVMAGASVLQGVQGAQAGMYGAAVAKRNAKLADQNAERAIGQGQVDAQDRDLELRQIMGQTVANQGASGFAVGSGSFQNVRESQASIGRTDRQRIIANAGVKAYNFRTQAADFMVQAEQQKMQAGNALLSGFINAGTSLIGASSSVGPKWGGMKSFNNDPTKLGALY